MAFTAGQRVRYRTTGPGGVWRDDWAGRTATVREDSGTCDTNIKWDAGPGVYSYNEDSRVLTNNLELIEEEVPADRPFEVGDQVRYKTEKTGDVYWDSAMSGKLGRFVRLTEGRNTITVRWGDEEEDMTHFSQNIEHAPVARTEYRVGDIIRLEGNRDGIPSDRGDLFRVTRVGPATSSGVPVAAIGDTRPGETWGFFNTHPIVTPVPDAVVTPEPTLPVSLNDVWAEGNTIQFTVRGRINAYGNILEVGCKSISLGAINKYLVDMVRVPYGYVTVTLQGVIEEYMPERCCSDCPEPEGEEYIIWDADRDSGKMSQCELEEYGRNYKLISEATRPF